MFDINIGDIVLVSKYKYSDGRDGTLHNMVVIDIVKNELTLTPLEHLTFLISSNKTKNSDVNPKYPYNEPIKYDRIDGHVKCDELISISIDNVIMKVGAVSPEQLVRYTDLYEEYLDYNMRAFPPSKLYSGDEQIKQEAKVIDPEEPDHDDPER